MYPILAALALLATMLTVPHAVPTAAAQQPTLDLSRDRNLREAIDDARRTGIITEARQVEIGTLQLTTGAEFNRSSSMSYNLGRIYLAYAAYQQGHEGAIALELLDRGERIGVYDKNGLRLSRRPAGASGPADGNARPHTTEPRRASGWYAALGAGSGGADFTCDFCRFDRSPALSGYLMVGRRTGERTVLGVEATGWGKSDDDTRGRLYTVTAVALARFDDDLPLFLSGGLGYAGYRRRLPTADVGADALGYSARLGTDLRLWRRLGVAPYLGIAGSFGSPEFTYEDGTPYRLSANFSNLQFGAALVLD